MALDKVLKETLEDLGVGFDPDTDLGTEVASQIAADPAALKEILDLALKNYTLVMGKG